MTAENPADTVIKQAARAITAALADAGLLADPVDRDELRSQLRRARQQRDDERAAKEGNWKALGEWSARAERAEAERDELRAEVSRLSMAKVNQRDAETEAADAVAELAIVEAERGELEHRLACLLCELTGNRMSNTGYDVPTMVHEVEAHFERTVDDEVVELRATIDRVRLLNTGWKSGQGNRHAYCINPESLRAALDGPGEQQ